MLKNYQREAIEKLDNFCSNIASIGINEAFKKVTTRQYLEIDEFKNPYVCIRIPTGGGKTLIATKSVRILVNEYLGKKYHIVFWLAPTDAIVSQTIQALKDKRHFYRSVLDKEFDCVNVLSIQEAYKQSFNPTEELVIIVGTIQSFRTASKDARKFYDDDNSNYLELLKSKDIQPSLSNVMKYFKPIIILDEAHKSSTTLSLQSLTELNPSFILELTATPVTSTNKAKGLFASNILHSTTATELKQESMIKLPIMLKTMEESLSVLQNGIAKREYLEKLAKIENITTNRYIRPINLIRAEENRGEQSLTFDKIKKILIEDFKINEDEIAIHTDKFKELSGIDLLRDDCKIRYIITVDALKEGWDCPFAYVLSVVSNMESKTAIEQLIGRVLRMPYIEEKNKKELGYSYVFVANSSFEDVANSIGETLIKSGFEEMEARISINYSTNTNESIEAIGGLFGVNIVETRQIKIENFDVTTLNKNIEPYVNYDILSQDFTIVSFPVKSKIETFVKDLKKIIPIEHHQEIDIIMQNIESLSDTQMSEISDFEVPKLMIEIDGELEFFEESIIFEYLELDEKQLVINANLTLDEFSIEQNEHIGMIDIERNKLKKIEIKDDDGLFEFQEDEEIKKLDTHKIDIVNNDLIRKLAHEIARLICDENSDILRVFDGIQLKEFISHTISNIINDRKVDITLLGGMKKYTLKKAIFKKILTIVSQTKQQSFQKLFEKSNFSTNNTDSFCFGTNSYKPNPDARSENFKKHRYKYVDKFDSSEEYDCALYIDKLDFVDTWIRNIARDSQNSFWLQTAKDKFYPDFILKLKDGRIVVAEYKGDGFIAEYEITKKPIGEKWAISNANCVFLSLYKSNFKSELERLNG